MFVEFGIFTGVVAIHRGLGYSMRTGIFVEVGIFIGVGDIRRGRGYSQRSGYS
jgi:hypothetical protein